MELYFDPAQLEAARVALGATEGQALRALTRALRRVTGVVKTRFAKELAAVAGKPKNFAKARLRAHLNKSKNGIVGLVWAGLDPISFSHFSPSAVVNPDGSYGVATVSPYVPYIPGAFIVKKIGNSKAGNLPVWMRNEKPLMPGVVEDRKKSGLPGIRRLASDRLTTEEIGADKALKYAEERIVAEFEHELEKEMKK